MKSPLTPRWVAVAVVVGLAGCGGSSSTRTADMTDPPTTPAGPTFRAYELPAAVAAGLTLAQGMTEELTIAAGGSLTWGPARFTCVSAVDCRVKLRGTSGGVRAETVGTVRTTLVDDPVAVDPGDGGSGGLAPIAVRVVKEAAGMTEEALREYIRQDAIRLNLNTAREREVREREIRDELRKGEPIHQAISSSNTSDLDLMEEGDGSVTQSSTTHARDMTASVNAWMRPTLDGVTSEAGSAGFSGSVLDKDGPRYNAPGGAPSATADDRSTPTGTGPTEFRKWRNWSTSVEHAATLVVDAGWRTPENEDANWRDASGALNANVALTHQAVAAMDFGERLDQSRRQSLMKELPGGRTVNVDLYTDVGRTAPASEKKLNGFKTDDASGVTGTMHTDWRRGLDVIDFDDNMRVKSPSELESGESEVFNEQRRSVTGTYRGIQGTFTCDTAKTDACHIRNQTGRVNVRGNFTFTPAKNQRVWDPDWLAIGVWHVVPDDQINGDYEAGAFVDGSKPFPASNLAAVTVSAEYKGPAHGIYTETMTRGSAVNRGRFSADATLTARFGNNNELGTISGRLRSFTSGGTARDWSLNLEQVGIGNIGSVVGSESEEVPIVPDPGAPDELLCSPASCNRFIADTSGHANGHAIEGRWGGRFYDGRIVNRDQPDYVAGTFGASMKDGPASNGYDVNLLGAFAAEWKRVLP